jgi:hypothetical protein
MKSPFVWIAVLVAAGVGALYYWKNVREAPPPPAAPPPPVARAPETAPEAAKPPAIQHPIPEAPPPAKPLPALADSDPAAQEAIAMLFGTEWLAKAFNTDAAVRRFVATVDNLPRKTASARLMPVKPVPGGFGVAGTGGDATIGSENALRYRPYIVAMEGVPAKRLVATYVQMYPLFQAAYQELGYPDAYFNDRLIVAIDDMLAAPEVAAPKVAQPKVLYQFADPALEDLSAGQKILVRMGPENAKRVKDKLRAIRRELTAQRVS